MTLRIQETTPYRVGSGGIFAAVLGSVRLVSPPFDHINRDAAERGTVSVVFQNFVENGSVSPEQRD